MKITKIAAVFGLAFGLFFTQPTQAQRIVVGVNLRPRPVYVRPRPVVVAPVYVAPRPVVVAPRRVYVRPRPVVVAPRRVYVVR